MSSLCFSSATKRDPAPWMSPIATTRSAAWADGESSAPTMKAIATWPKIAARRPREVTRWPESDRPTTTAPVYWS